MTKISGSENEPVTTWSENNILITLGYLHYKLTTQIIYVHSLKCLPWIVLVLIHVQQFFILNFTPTYHVRKTTTRYSISNFYIYFIYFKNWFWNLYLQNNICKIFVLAHIKHNLVNHQKSVLSTNVSNISKHKSIKDGIQDVNFA